MAAGAGDGPRDWYNSQISLTSILPILPYPTLVGDTLQKSASSQFNETEILLSAFGAREEMSAALAKGDAENTADRARKYLPYVIALGTSLPPEAPYKCTWRSSLSKAKTTTSGNIVFEKALVEVSLAIALHNCALSTVSALPAASIGTSIPPPLEAIYKQNAQSVMTSSAIVQLVSQRVESIPFHLSFAECNQGVLAFLSRFFAVCGHVITISLSLQRGASLGTISRLSSHAQREFEKMTDDLTILKGQPLVEVDLGLVFHVEALASFFGVMTRRLAALANYRQAKFGEALGHLKHGEKYLEKMKTTRYNASGMFSSYLPQPVLDAMEWESREFTKLSQTVVSDNAKVAHMQPKLEVEAPEPACVTKSATFEEEQPAFASLTLKDKGMCCIQ